MSAIEEDKLKTTFHRVVGAWAVSIIATIAGGAFYLGQLAERVETRMTSLETKLEEVRRIQETDRADTAARREDWYRWRYAVQNQADTNQAYLTQIESRFQPVERQYWRNR